VLKDRVGRLIQFLKDLVTARAVPVRQITGHLDHLWLNDVRELAVVDPEAGPGEVLLRLPRVSLDPAPELPDLLHGWVTLTDRDNSSLAAPPLRRSIALPSGERVALSERPEVAAAYEDWLPGWQRWAAADRPKRLLQRTYDRLRAMRQQMTESPETVEAVLGGGLLSLPDHGLYTHVLTHRVAIGIEAETGDAVVSLDLEAVTSLEDNRVLTGLDVFDDGGTAVLRGRIAELDVRPSSENALTFLKEWTARALLRPVEAAGDWEPPSIPTTVISPAPAIVLRRRGAYALQEYYTHIERTLAEEGEAVPLGLAQLVESIEAEDRIAWLEASGATAGADVAEDPLFPLPANEEQSQIIGRLRGDTGVVVEGPPGTGKTHTIANLMSALLARGQRVLVTSEKAQALKVLRDKLPAEMQELCVSITDAGRGGSLELSKSVSRLATEHSAFNPTRAQRTIDDLAGKLHQARRQRVSVLEGIRGLREAETCQHPAVAEGYGGTLARIAERVSARAAQFSWMPTSVAGVLPLTPAEFEELRQALPGDTELRHRRRDQVMPLATVVPDLPVVERLATDVRRGANARTGQTSALSEVIGQLDAPTLAALIEICGQMRDLLEVLSSGVDASWSLPVLESVLRGDDDVLWAQVSGARQLVSDALAMNVEIGYRQVDVSVDVPPAPASGIFAELARYLGSGGGIKKIFKSDEQKAAEPYLSGILVDAQSVTTAVQAHIVGLHFSTLARLQAFASQAALLAIPGAVPGPRPVQVSHANRIVTTIQSIDQLRLVRDRLRVALAQVPAMPRVDLGTIQGARTFVDIATVFADVEVARRAHDQLELLATSLEASVERAQRPPELTALVAALRNADDEQYAVRLHELESAQREQRVQRRCDELADRLFGASPELLAVLRRTALDPAWDQRLPLVSEAWHWASAATFVREHTAPGREALLTRELEVVDRDLAKLTAQLAAAQAWQAALERMNATQVSALQAYRDNMANVGKGTGKYAQRYRLAAREAMTAAQEAVPAWVMPLQEVLASIPPHQNAFDVVIVDEASQVGIENLFLLWLAPRVIVVGDDRQCTPSEVKHGALDKVFSRLDTLLPDMPGYMRATLTPRSSVFSTMRTRFGQVIRLREHFRCMPEIITWSSQMFYRDAPLVPVRQHGADRLQPLKTTYVPAAYTEGQYATLRNVVEAEAIVDAVGACLQDPAYDDKTFGVVVLQGRAQIDVIKEALFRRVDPEEWEQRRIRIGTPPDFQGDERDVVLLSMVTAPDHKRASQTKLDAQRAFNVAASRARDQLWLFHSVTSDQLRPDDLRSQLLTYMTAMPVAAAAAMPDDVTDDERHAAFDSLFEQRVFRRIRQRGYHVTPQVEVNARRIDLVVTGSQGKLAVECDGDAWHSSPEQVASDFARELELRRCGWEFWRIRESRYYLDPDAALADLWSTLDKRGIGPAVIEGTANGADWVPGPLSDEEGADDLAQDPELHPSVPGALISPTAAHATQESHVAGVRSERGSTLPEPTAGSLPPGPTQATMPSARTASDEDESRAVSEARPAGSGRVVDEPRQLVLELAADGAVTTDIVSRFLEISQVDARRLLTTMTVEQLLERRGVTKGTHYVLPGTTGRAARPLPHPAVDVTPSSEGETQDPETVPSTDAASSTLLSAARLTVSPSGPVRQQPRQVVDERTRRAVFELARSRPVSNGIVRHRLGIASDEAARILKVLVSEGLLDPRGSGAGARYTLASNSAVAWGIHGRQVGSPGSVTAVNREPIRSEPSESAASPTQDALEAAFERRLRDDVETVIARSGYRPSYYLRLISTDGAVGAARKLLSDPRPQHGLETLWENNLLAHSLEAAVLDERHRTLFSEWEVDAARQRLKALGFISADEEPS
jgi:very-short-patch-repair endonuclease